MASPGCAKFCKRFLHLINTLFIILGIVIVALGAYAYSNGQKYSITPTVAEGVIVLGCVVFTVSFFGFVGAWRLSACWLWIVIFFFLFSFFFFLFSFFFFLFSFFFSFFFLFRFKSPLTLLSLFFVYQKYFVFVLLLFGAQIAVGIVIYADPNLVKTYVSDSWNTSSDATKNLTQNTYNCCGLTAWNDTAYYPCPDGTYANSTNGSSLPGCETKLVDSITNNLQVSGAILLAAACVQFFALILTMALACMAKDLQDDPDLHGFC